MNDMQEAEGHPMDVAAQEAIAQGWCEPETSSQEMDVVLTHPTDGGRPYVDWSKVGPEVEAALIRK